MMEIEDPYATIDDTTVQNKRSSVGGNSGALDIAMDNLSVRQRSHFPASDVSDLYARVMKPAKSQPSLSWRDHLEVNGVSYAVVKKKNGSSKCELEYYDNDVSDVKVKPTHNSRCLSEGNLVEVNGDIYAVINKIKFSQQRHSYDEDVRPDDVFVDGRDTDNKAEGLVVVTDCTTDSDSDHAPRLGSGSSDYYVSMCAPTATSFKPSFRTSNCLLNESIESLVDEYSAPVSPLFRRKCYGIKRSNDMRNVVSTSVDDVQQYTTLRDLCSDSDDSIGCASYDGYHAVTRSLEDITDSRHQRDMNSTVEGIGTAARSYSQEDTLSTGQFNSDDFIPRYGRPRSGALVVPGDDMLRKARQRVPLPPTPDTPSRTERLVMRISKKGKLLSRRKRRTVRSMEPLPPPPTPPPASSSPRFSRRGPHRNSHSPNAEVTVERPDTRSPVAPYDAPNFASESLERRNNANVSPKGWFRGLSGAQGNSTASSKYTLSILKHL